MTMEGALLVPTAVNLRIQSYFQKKKQKQKPNTYSVFNFFSAHKGFLKFGWENEWQGFYWSIALFAHYGVVSWAVFDNRSK